jgi:hypothetical protein
MGCRLRCIPSQWCALTGANPNRFASFQQLKQVIVHVRISDFDGFQVAFGIVDDAVGRLSYLDDSNHIYGAE